ncbi:serum amyloid P-component-like isoform X2 [Syngnathoides biaculeatus]|uniref:serum amyloid P-component-like isoform X2 n=1 Tax=Syngnathoides biaculeatus TaxID=300417 RepID=UPI002ADD3EF4|nr:serum amyloid P-component-like isoform X2 [Syngnathoides biaculeatus]
MALAQFPFESSNQLAPGVPPCLMGLYLCPSFSIPSLSNLCHMLLFVLMAKLLVFMLMLASCCAKVSDLSGKVLVFPRETSTDHVKLMTPKTSFNAVTVCFRFLTDLTRNYVLFSLATPAVKNDFVIFKANSDVMRVHVRNGGTDFLSLSFPPNFWHTLCSTWNSANGISQLWVDGKPTIKRFIHSGQPISGIPITILGQEQDTYGGGFDASQSFIGMISRLHMWDYVLSPSEIRLYEEESNFTPGNVFNWRALDFEIIGNILVDNEVL